MDVDAPPTIASSLAASPTSIMVHGTAVDLAGTGLDIAFLEALPDDLRAEVIAQHQRDSGASISRAMPAAELSADFLNALPSDIRDEIMEQEAAASLGQVLSTALRSGMGIAQGGG